MRERETGEREGSDCFKIGGVPAFGEGADQRGKHQRPNVRPFCAEANLATAHVAVKAGGTQTSRSTICTIYIRTAFGNSAAR